jgi:NADH-quinone oxidoreductase subunit L
MSVTFNGHERVQVHALDFIRSGDFTVDWAFRLDTLTAVMLVVVNSVSALVHLYSIGYMSHDEHRARFFAYLSLFTFAMLMLVTADNLLADVLRLGRRGRRLLPADRLLVQKAPAPTPRR